MFVTPLGAYLDVGEGARCGTVAWVQIEDSMIPTLAKVTGKYVNSAFAKTEANENGYDEAIQLTAQGHVSEGSGENIFIVRNGTLITPPVTDGILVGITRECVMTLAREELGVETVERSIARSELYAADECFMTGTAAHITPVIEVDRRPIAEGLRGAITKQLVGLYSDIIQGKNAKYRDWCTPVYSRVGAVRS
jgi:branched-chain amino acid aminotransferase